jgi:hypothetical protein
MANLLNYLRNLFESRTDKTMFIGAPTLRYQEIIDIIDAGVGQVPRSGSSRRACRGRPQPIDDV